MVGLILKLLDNCHVHVKCSNKGNFLIQKYHNNVELVARTRT